MCNRNRTLDLKGIFKKQNHKAKIFPCLLDETSLTTNDIFSANICNQITLRLGHIVQEYFNAYRAHQQCNHYFSQTRHEQINDLMKYYVASAVLQTHKNLLLINSRRECFDEFTLIDC